MYSEYQNCYDQAIRYLSTREHSQVELTKKLGSKGYGAEVITEVLTSLITQNYQSDERFCAVLIRSRTQKGKGRLLIEQEFFKHGVLDYVYLLDEVDFAELCNEVAHKKYGEQLPTEAKAKAKCIRFLTSRGFSNAEIRSVFVGS